MAAVTQTLQVETRPAQAIIREVPVTQAPNGVCYAHSGEIALAPSELERMVGAVPRPIAAALTRNAYYFVPLTVNDADETVIASRYDAVLSDKAVCHRNITSGDSQCVFISTRLMEDKFAVGFEFLINIAHAFVERAGVSPDFADLAWSQVDERVRGETSLDAWDARKLATGGLHDAPKGVTLQQALEQGIARVDEKAKTDYLNATFADSIAVYMLSMYLDIDYYDLRERDYPLLAPPALAERLRKVAQLFAANPGYEFNIFYRRRS
jgi:hypothetical protein